MRSGLSRRHSGAIAIGLVLLLSCLAADHVIDLSLDVADAEATVTAESPANTASAPQLRARQPQPTGEDYDPDLYRADLRRPKQWGS